MRHSHSVQLYQDDVFLVREVSAYFEKALKSESAVLVIATPEHSSAFLKALTDKKNIPSLLKSGRLEILNAHEVLGKISIDYWPDSKRFAALVGGLVEKKLAAFDRLAVYGEVVNLMWQAGHPRAAMRLEGLWNELAARLSFDLYCGYKLDFLDSKARPDFLEKVCTTHSTAVISQDTPKLERAVRQATAKVIGEPQAEMIRFLMGQEARRGNFNDVAHSLLWLRRNMPKMADRVLKQARIHYHELRSLGERSFQ